jgi:hypothetical protein
MALDRVTDCRFMNDAREAENSSREMLKIILANKSAFDNIKKGREFYSAAFDMSKEPGDLTPGQRSYVESIYERMWQGKNYESVPTHIDKKRKGLRF